MSYLNVSREVRLVIIFKQTGDFTYPVGIMNSDQEC